MPMSVASMIRSWGTLATRLRTWIGWLRVDGGLRTFWSRRPFVRLRAALMTGCFHTRVGIHGAYGPHSKVGIDAGEVTLGELCRERGYATACFGKWHLGDQYQFLPLQNGFDEYYGLPYSNDMWPLHPDYVKLPEGIAKRKRGYPDLPMYEGNEIVDPEITGDDQKQLTTQYTEHAIDFIHRHRDRPFFLYVPHSMVHVPLFVSDKFAGKSKRGLFGDVMMEVDWSMGQIIAALESDGLLENTLVVFTSDNGPWLSYGDHAGSAGWLREGKGTEFEGGARVPTIMSWPGKIRAGTTCDELASTIDILPTIARLIDAPLPSHPIDGVDIWPLMTRDETIQSPHRAFPMYYAGGELQAIRDRRWKLHFPHTYRTLDGKPGGTGGQPAPYSNKQIGLELFDLKNDRGETVDVAADHPDVVARLEKAADAFRHELGDKLQKIKGVGVRGPGRVAEDESPTDGKHD